MYIQTSSSLTYNLKGSGTSSAIIRGTILNFEQDSDCSRINVAYSYDAITTQDDGEGNTIEVVTSIDRDRFIREGVDVDNFYAYSDPLVESITNSKERDAKRRYEVFKAEMVARFIDNNPDLTVADIEIIE